MKNTMKTILSIIAFLAITSTHAQYIENAPWMQNLDVQARKKSNNPIKFQEVIDAANLYWESHDRHAKGSGYKPFKRWENHWKNFVKEDGTLPTAKEFWQMWETQKASNSLNRNSMADESDWQPVGPFNHTNTGGGKGQGRINVIVKDANNPNYYYAGAPAGGLWKSTDGGVTWETPTTDNLPQIGVSGIALDPDDSNIIYIATGDDDGSSSYSVGVMKSIDGGLTWNTTGLDVSTPPGAMPNSMNDIYVVKDNNNPNLKTIIVATSIGVKKSIDGGATWTTSSGIFGNITDIKIKPGSSNIVYAATNTAFYRSSDMGNTFSLVSNGIPTFGSSRLVIDVTNANPDYVYVLAAFSNSWSYRALYRSTDSGNTFNEISNQAQDGNIFETNQTFFNMALAVSDTNPNEFYTGALNIWKGVYNPATSDTQFTQINDWRYSNQPSYTHGDIHFLRFFEGELLAGTDGGFYKSTDGGTNFTDLTAGMQISEVYRLSVAKTSSNKIAAGLQDNGGFALNNGQWQSYHTLDGTENVINPSNSNQYFGISHLGGFLFSSDNSGASRTSSITLAPEAETGRREWVTPLAMNTDNELYAAYTRLYKLENNNWVPVSPSFVENCDVLEIDDLNPDNIYIVSGSDSLYKSTDRGISFSELIPPGFGPITAIEVNNNDSNIFYVVQDGSIYKTTNGGNTYSNISTGLPPGLVGFNIHMIKHQGLHPKNPLFIATVLGVYRYDDDTLTWEAFNMGLPNVDVNDIEINVIDDKITAATYGRGFWQSTIPTELAATDVRLVTIDGISNSIECNENIAPQITIENNGLSTITAVDITYTIDGVDTLYNWTGTLNSEATTVVNIPQFSLAKGSHTFKVIATTSNDAYEVNNNSEVKKIIVNSSAGIQVINTFETATEALLVEDDFAATQYWQRGIPTGTLLNDNTNPTNQVYGTNLAGLHANNIKSYLISECYDLTIIANPVIKFDMAFDLELDKDVVYMEYSTNQGANWSVLGTATDPNWYNSNTLPNPIFGAFITTGCNTCTEAGAQWTGTNATLTEYSYDLTAFTDETNMLFRFVFHSDESSILKEGVIVDNLVIAGNVLSIDEYREEEALRIWPNPSNGEINVSLNLEKNDEVKISLFDLTGRLISQKSFDNQTDNFREKLQFDNLNPSVYILSIENNGKRVHKQVVVK